MSRILIAFCLLGLVSSSADAQSSPFQRDARTTAGWVFTPGASVGGLWDSGIQTDADPGVEALFQKWVVLANPHAELDFNGRRTHFNLGYSGSFEKYWTSSLNWVQSGRAGVTHTVTPRLNISGDTAYTVVPTTDRLQLVNGAVPYLPVNSRWIDAGGGFTFRASTRTTVNGAYRFQSVTFDEDTPVLGGFGQLRDGYTQSQTVGFMREFSTRLSLGAEGQYRRDNIGEVEYQFEVKTVTGQFSYRLDSVSTIFGGGGASSLESPGTGEGTTAPTFNAGFSRVMRTVRVNASYSRGFEQLFGFGSLAGSDTFSGGAFIPFAERVYYLDSSLTYTHSDPGRSLGIGLDYTTLWSNVAVGRQLTPYLRGEGFVSFAHQSSNGQDSTQHTRIGIQIVTSKPMRIQ